MTRGAGPVGPGFPAYPRPAGGATRAPADSEGMDDVIDDGFMADVAPLSVPEMGTDAVAPLLYWLIRMIRPRRVLEVGMGYTTPFLARGLHDNMEAADRERSLLGDERQPLAYPAYHDRPHTPQLVCVDRMTDPASSATRVLKVLTRLGLAERCTVIEADLRGSGPAVAEHLGLIDFAWIDTWDTLAFVREYWGLIDPAGGVLAVHYLMTYPEGRAIQHYLRSLAGPDGGRLEMISFREPHRVAQNSITLLRRVRDYRDPEDLRPAGAANDPTGVLDPGPPRTPPGSGGGR